MCVGLMNHAVAAGAIEDSGEGGDRELCARLAGEAGGAGDFVRFSLSRASHWGLLLISPLSAHLQPLVVAQ